MTERGNNDSSSVAVGVLAKLGIPVYGLGAVMLGGVGVVSGDFADVWQPVPSDIPHRKAIAYCAAACLLVAGIAIQSRQLARIAASVLGVFYFIFGLLWLPRVFAYPKIFATWGGVFEQLSLAAAAMIVYASAGEGNERLSARGTAQTGRVLFGICAVAFAFNHFFALPQTADMVPKWIPPGQYFWAVATGLAHLLAGIAIVSGVLAVAGSRLLTLMLILFGALVWLPSLAANPRNHTVWSGNAINLCIAGAAWVVADFVAAQSARRKTSRTLRTVASESSSLI
jgi:uncharacterized membrane protein YphA (DoxX/SURF4 family)